MFMHGGWEHILGNLLFLWVFGNNIEDSMGHIRFIVFYLLCGILAGLAHVLLSPTSSLPAVGASGAIGGIMGAYVLLYPRVRVRTWVPPFFFLNLPALFVLGYWFVLQIIMAGVTFGPEAGEQGGVAVWAHIGGFVAGLVLIRLFEKPRLVAAKRAGIQLSREEVARLEW
jgi:membrane associated rhomboid family serine protease